MLLYMRALHERYGTDTDAMFADIKLNYLQFTKKRLADMLALYLKKHEQLEIEERLGTLEEIDPDKDCEREIADVDRILDGIDLGDVSTDDELFDQLVEEFNITDALPEGALESDDAMDEEEPHPALFTYYEYCGEEARTGDEEGVYVIDDPASSDSYDTSDSNAENNPDNTYPSTETSTSSGFLWDELTDSSESHASSE